MTNKKWMWAGAITLAVGLLAWFGRGTTEREGLNHVAVSADIALAAVARVERHNVGNTLTIAGDFKPFQDVNVHAKVARPKVQGLNR